MDQRRARRRGARGLPGGAIVLLGLLGLLASSPTIAADAVLPQYAPVQHLGVVNCAGSTCHGATRPFKNSHVLQNEFVTWDRQGKHSQAYKVLLNDKSKRIARNLGIAAPEKAKICLDCHADNVPPAERGPRFQISDGVGCEACHGGAERYLGPHVARDATHKNNISLGMYPTEQPALRAALCLSCHMGTKDKFATHRIMGAGHPRLSFELDTFSDIQPAHYRVDADYRQRKGYWSGTQVWAAGQVVAVRQYLDTFLARESGAHGVFPELSFFDCLGCHRVLKSRRWTPVGAEGLPPGSVRLNDANMLMLRTIVSLVAPGKAATYHEAVLAMHAASTKSMPDLLAAAKRLRAVVAGLEPQILDHGFSGAQMKTLLMSVVKDGEAGAYANYVAAEQAAMALGSLVNAMETAGASSAAQAAKLKKSLDAVYAALQNEDEYQPDKLVTAMKSFEGDL